MYKHYRLGISLLLVIGVLLLPLAGNPHALPHADAASTPVPAVPAASNQPAQVGFFGMNTYFTGFERIWNDTVRDANGTIIFDGTPVLAALGREAGIPWAREEISWANIEGLRRKAREFDEYDRRLKLTADAGYGIIGMVSTTPEWARVTDCLDRRNRYAAQGHPRRAVLVPACQHLPARLRQHARQDCGALRRRRRV
ncbi:MAG: hypothetical protein HC893_07010 [Chloroflexaceae bacterium]|nr:hypothetical protein [Chloroflexaceae bacterium]